MPQIGPYTLHTIETGRFRLDGGAMFGIIPKPLWEKKIEADAKNRIPLNMRCLLIEGLGRRILVDTGIGSKFSEKFASIYGVDHSEHTLDASLSAAGIAPASITDVILTHLHFDHAGGATCERDGGVVPAFPEATYHVQRDHWSAAHAPTLREKNSFLRHNFDPIEAAGQLNLIDGPETLWSGIDVIPIHGHTQAQQMIKIYGENADTLLYAADLVPTTAHVPLVWGMGFDIRPLITIDEKQTYLRRAADGGWTLFFEHDPAVEIANIARTDRGFEAVQCRSLSEL
jgi:glyoxylase-like metal-dependent hydrolase (beta-lactamase superfamily II)